MRPRTPGWWVAEHRWEKRYGGHQDRYRRWLKRVARRAERRAGRREARGEK